MNGGYDISQFTVNGIQNGWLPVLKVKKSTKSNLTGTNGGSINVRFRQLAERPRFYAPAQKKTEPRELTQPKVPNTKRCNQWQQRQTTDWWKKPLWLTRAELRNVKSQGIGTWLRGCFPLHWLLKSDRPVFARSSWPSMWCEWLLGYTVEPMQNLNFTICCPGSGFQL